jgi:transcription antitermination factor NusG
MRWICARLEPQREKTAQHFLQLSGYCVYVPLVCEYIVRRKRRLELVRPLFPAYAFVGLTEQQGFYGVRWALGVSAVIMNGAGPAHVQQSVLDALRAREVNGVVRLPKDGFKIGDPVRVRAGVLEGHRGLYDGQAPHERVAVLLALLGSQRRVELPRHDVEAIEPAP